MRDRLADSVVDQYEGSDISAAGQVFLSKDSSSFLSQLATMAAYSDYQDQLFNDYATEIEALDIRHDATERRAEQVAALEKRLAAEKKTIDAKHSEAEALLDRLKEEEREAHPDSRGGSGCPPTCPPPAGPRRYPVRHGPGRRLLRLRRGRARAPSTAPGLTMMASWAQAGVGLPHSSSAQYSSGAHVSADATAAGRPGLLLQPDQPRRDVHRQRPDRARRQPRLRCRSSPTSTPCRTSVRSGRADPLATIPRFEDRPSTLVGGRSFAVPPCSGRRRSPGTRRVPTPTSRRGPTTPGRGRPRAATATLDDLTAAVESGDTGAAAELAGPDDAASSAQLVSLATNAGLLDLEDFTLRYVDEASGISPDGTWSAAVDATWAFGGFDDGSVAHRGARDVPGRLLTTRRRARIVSVGGGDRRSPVWMYGPVAVRRTPRDAGAGGRGLRGGSRGTSGWRRRRSRTSPAC